MSSFSEDVNLKTPDVQQVQQEVKKWLSIEARRRELNDQVRAMRADQKKIESQIIGFMKENQIPQFNFQNGEGRLSLSTTNSKSQIKPTDLAIALKQHLSDEEVQNVMKSIEDARSVKTTHSLKHSG